MEIQNNSTHTTPQPNNFSLGVKILLVIGGFFAASSATGTVLSTCALSFGFLLFWGVVFSLGSLALSRVNKAEIRFALVVPFYLSGMSMIGAGLFSVLEFSFQMVFLVMSLLSIPTILLAGTGMLRHLAVAQFFWMLPFCCSEHSGHAIVFQVMAYGAITLYLATILAEKTIAQHPLVAAEKRALRIVLLMLAIGLLLWIEFGIFGHSDGVQSVIVAVLMLPLTFWASDKVGLTLSTLFLIYALTLFYYNVEVDLLHKSLLLMGSGVVFLALFFVLRKLIR